MDKSSSLLQSTVTKIGNMMQGAGGVRHMLLLIVFAFVMVSRPFTFPPTAKVFTCFVFYFVSGLSCCAGSCALVGSKRVVYSLWARRLALRY